MEELRYQKLEEIKVDSKLVASASFKPTKAPIICGVVGIALLFVNSLLVRILGFFFVAMALFVFFMVEDKKTIDVYENGAVIFNPSNSELAYYLDFDNVSEWDVVHESGHDTIEFTLLDGNRAVVDTFQSSKIYSALDKVMPDKAHLAVQAKRNKDLNISPVDALKNLLKKK